MKEGVCRLFFALY